MPKLSTEKRSELEAFWRAHHEAWKRSDLNQREYCEVNGLPLKRFGNWRCQFRREPRPEPADLLYRRGGLSHSFSHRLSHTLSHMTKLPAAPNAAPSVPPHRQSRRRTFSLSDKRKIVRAASQPGTSLSQVAREYGIAARVLFRWKQELAVADDSPRFVTVEVAS